jgi:hypothetical protein
LNNVKSGKFGGYLFIISRLTSKDKMIKIKSIVASAHNIICGMN